MARLRALLALVLTLLAFAAAPVRAATSPFADWAVIIVAGDNHAGGGGRSEVFDNGRRDLAKELVTAGFTPGNILQFSIQAERYPDQKPLSALPLDGMFDRFAALTKTARAGCLIYFTSHGSPQGIVVGDDFLTPAHMAHLVDDNCGKRPTVAVVSACFSGVFVRTLEWPNRLVMTAARPDRTSFGCGADDKYTFFDGCFLQELSRSSTLQALTQAVPACVTKREVELGVDKPSEPQIFAGPQIRATLPLYDLAKPPG